jgi:hypothetical protein
MSIQETERIKDTESKKERQGPEFLLFPEFKVSCSFEPARLDLRAVGSAVTKDESQDNRRGRRGDFR